MHPIFFSVILLLVVIPFAYGQISDRTGLKQDFTIETEGNTFQIDVTSNFNVEDVEFSSDDKRLTFFINSNLENNLGEIQIPKNLINGNFTFILNDQEIFPTVKASEKISFITVEFDGSGKNKLDIIELTFIPESSEKTPLILFVLVIVLIFASIAVIIFARKIKKHGNYSFNKD